MTIGRAIVACEVFRPELQSLLGGNMDRCYFLPQGLHRQPGLLRRTLQGIIDGLDANACVHTILFAYGLCGKGLDGIRSLKSRLIVPHSEDCIAVLHGVKAFHCPSQVDRTGTYYLSAGWIRYGSDAYKEYRRCLTFLDNDEAFWAAKEMIRHYRRFAVIDTGLPSLRDDCSYARTVAEFFGLDYAETRGSTDWLVKLLESPATDRLGEEFVAAGPEHRLTPGMFYRCV